MPTILYIEDNEQNMRLVRKILQHAGYDVVEAVTGESGVVAAISHCPDLVLVDINLPDIDGLEVTRQLKHNYAMAHIPIIALTANAMVGDRERMLTGGCDGYLAKPVARQDLLDTVSRFLAVH
ncbi:MAG: response regulator [Armatimonadetes bacterium]|nr:response regulator [Anaerolineae bacterium]